MPIKIEDGTDDIVEIRAIGKLTKEDFTAFVPEFEGRVRRLGKLRVLFDITSFDGWQPDGIWEEIKFDWKHNSDYRRLAVVGDEKWQHLLVTAFKPFTFAEVRYFSLPQSDQARQWLLRP
ncbi:MAG TPA: STAS/SEC14 domain-containing protein [Acidobacteriaceae bacterium]|nr:STAS/SEC14 domain-containing protein [Acidobacteriaceae bacterium]